MGKNPLGNEHRAAAAVLLPLGALGFKPKQLPQPADPHPKLIIAAYTTNLPSWQSVEFKEEEEVLPQKYVPAPMTKDSLVIVTKSSSERARSNRPPDQTFLMMRSAAALLLLLGALGAAAAAPAKCNVELYARAESEGGKLTVRAEPVPWATVRGVGSRRN